MKEFIGIVGLIALILCLFGAASATTVVDISSSIADVTAGGNADASQSGAHSIAANGDVLALASLGATATANCGTSDVKQTNTQKVTGATNVIMQGVIASDQTAKKGGILEQEATQSTSNSGDTSMLAINTGKQLGGTKANYDDKQKIAQSGYGAENNEVTGINDLSSITGPCGSVKFVQDSTKNIDPKNVISWDENDASAISGEVTGKQSFADTIGATKSIDATGKNNANTFAWKTSTLEQKGQVNVFSPGNMNVLTTESAKSVAVFGDAKVKQGTVVDVNTHPWGQPLLTQVVGLGTYSTADVNSILGDASSAQTTTTNVH